MTTRREKEIANLYALLSYGLNPNEARPVEKRIRELEAQEADSAKTVED